MGGLTPSHFFMAKATQGKKKKESANSKLNRLEDSIRRMGLKPGEPVCVRFNLKDRWIDGVVLDGEYWLSGFEVWNPRHFHSISSTPSGRRSLDLDRRPFHVGLLHTGQQGKLVQYPVKDVKPSKSIKSNYSFRDVFC